VERVHRSGLFPVTVLARGLLQHAIVGYNATATVAHWGWILTAEDVVQLHDGVGEAVQRVQMPALIPATLPPMITMCGSIGCCSPREDHWAVTVRC
jgi:hypothetical protein